jgi:hypothetical protein
MESIEQEWAIRIGKFESRDRDFFASSVWSFILLLCDPSSRRDWNCIWICVTLADNLAVHSLVVVWDSWSSTWIWRAFIKESTISIRFNCELSAVRCFRALSRACAEMIVSVCMNSHLPRWVSREFVFVLTTIMTTRTCFLIHMAVSSVSDMNTSWIIQTCCLTVSFTQGISSCKQFIVRAVSQLYSRLSVFVFRHIATFRINDVIGCKTFEWCLS